MRLTSSTGLVVITTVFLTTPSSTRADTLYRELEVGMSGSDVSSLQTFLAKDKTLYPEGKVTGYFGSLTKRAVLNFQRRNGIQAIGRVGPLTLSAIKDKINSNSTPTIPESITSTTPATVANPIISNNTPTTTSTSSTATTLKVKLVPLLSGGVARAGASVPVSYLQITNTGQGSATLTGFTIKQNGSAPAESTIIGLTTVDDKGDLRGSIGGTEGTALFTNASALAPVNITLAPGQMRLFTIKAKLSININAYIGQQLMIDVTSIDTNAKVEGNFPIRGTTWTIAK